MNPLILVDAMHLSSPWRFRKKYLLSNTRNLITHFGSEGLLTVSNKRDMTICLILLRLVHADCSNGNGNNWLYLILWIAVPIATGLHVNTSIRSNVTHSWYEKDLGFRCRCRSQCEQAFNYSRLKNTKIWVLPPASEGLRKVMFSLYPPFRGGGYPVLGLGGGYPIPGLDGGYPIPGRDRGYPLAQDWMGTPNQQDGVPPIQDWMGYLPSKAGWGTPRPRLYGVTLQSGGEHLLRGGRCVSCVHAGGLSCSSCFPNFDCVVWLRRCINLRMFNICISCSFFLQTTGAFYFYRKPLPHYKRDKIEWYIRSDQKCSLLT